MKQLFSLFFFLYILLPQTAQAQVSRWTICPDSSLVWKIDERLPHSDHIEMSGQRVSVVLRYGVDAQGAFHLERSMVWPLLRTLPNNTHASLMQRFALDIPSLLIVNGRSLQGEQVDEIRLKGLLQVRSRFHIGHASARANSQQPTPVLEVTRTYFPSVTQPLLCEHYLLRNISDKPLAISVPQTRLHYNTDPEKGLKGSYNMVLALEKSGFYHLAPGEEMQLHASVQAFASDQTEIRPHIPAERQAREQLVAHWWQRLRFESPDSLLNTAFAFAKIRASESIYATAGGPMHGPGGESYYAALWANDQAEYINPYFAYAGYDYGAASALNAYRHFARFMNPEYRPIPSSIIAEGTDIWNGAGDRGDAAMIAYGAARYALARGDRQEAASLWPLISWCLEYCRRQYNADGVVASDSDELEGRFPAGEANLCTSALYYDALRSAACLARDLGKPSEARQYSRQADVLEKAIERYFGGEVQGFDTYRYYQGNTLLRAWICIPLTVGLYQRKEATVAALFSPHLWTENGLLTAAQSSTFWDRSTLYALRGVFAAGATPTAMTHFRDYSRTRLLGEHVPYPIEAWPEGSQRHLSAESGLYARVVTEGIFGLRPTGLRSFSLCPRLIADWPQMALRSIHAFGAIFDIEVRRLSADKIQISIIQDKKTVWTKQTKAGDTVEVQLNK